MIEEVVCAAAANVDDSTTPSSFTFKVRCSIRRTLADSELRKAARIGGIIDKAAFGGQYEIDGGFKGVGHWHRIRHELRGLHGLWDIYFQYCCFLGCRARRLS